MIKRHLHEFLNEWKASPGRRPLILRGARQVGKSTLIREFGKGYDYYLEFNLEKKADRTLFDNLDDLSKTIQLLYLTRGIRPDEDKSHLIFLDEVQEKPALLESLRYFYEDHPHLHVIATGSLLEFSLDKVMRTPVGRVSYADLHPLNFEEYLGALGHQVGLDAYGQLPFPDHLTGPLFDLFHEYVMIGGMPAMVSAYLTADKDLAKVSPLYADLIHAYREDVEKYALSHNHRQAVRHLMDVAPHHMDNRINLSKLGGNAYRSREMRAAFTALEKARLLELVHPTTQTHLPITPALRKRPRLHFLDVGLINHQLGLHAELLSLDDLHAASKGKLVQQVVSQELRSLQQGPGERMAFWVREEGTTSSEVDLVYPYRDLLLPVEIKSGAKGRLRSLHEYMDRCPHGFAVRFYKGPVRMEDMKTRKGKAYKLMSLPYFLAGKLRSYVKWMVGDE